LGNLLAAEPRSLYFGDLATRYTRHKQIITGCSFFFSSGAAATLIGKAPEWMPIVLSILVAASTAYAIAIGLDRKVGTMAKLHSSWKRVASEYDTLWKHTYADNAETELERIIDGERELAELATTEAPNDQKLLGKWQDRVFQLFHVANV